MKKFFNNKYILIIATLAIGGLIGWSLKPASEHSEAIVEHDHSNESSIWTCSMHPQIRQSEPGSCPICGMDLIPVESGQDDGIDPSAISMSPTAIKLAGVATSIVGESAAVKSVRLNGKVEFNEKLIAKIPAQFHGRIEKLHINYTGEMVKQGQLLAEVYSPELLTAQKELIIAAKSRDTNPGLYNSAKQKLKNWKISDAEIKRIEETGASITNFKIHAHTSGVVIKRFVAQGDHVQMGDPLFEVANLSKVWVLFDVYESELAWIKTGDSIQFNIESIPGKNYNGKISYIDPVIDPTTRVAKARVEVSNPDLSLKPEMFVSGIVETRIDKIDNALVIPKSSVMWTGERSVIYVKSENDNGISFQVREVTLGPALGDGYIVKQGLKIGEEIATSGTFSIDAAAQLAGKPSMMGSGSSVIGHDHDKAEVKSDPQLPSNTYDAPDKFESKVKQVYKAYLPLKNALVASDGKMAREASEKLLKTLNEIDMTLLKGEAHNIWMDLLKPMTSSIEKMANTEDLEVQRKELITLSNNLFTSIKTFQISGLKGFYQYCPMADNFKGAYWISAEDDIKNPYFGDAMLTCGEVVEELK